MPGYFGLWAYACAHILTKCRQLALAYASASLSWHCAIAQVCEFQSWLALAHSSSSGTHSTCWQLWRMPQQTRIQKVGSSGVCLSKMPRAQVQIMSSCWTSICTPCSAHRTVRPLFEDVMNFVKNKQYVWLA